jgi:hypothetical protein
MGERALVAEGSRHRAGSIAPSVSVRSLAMRASTSSNEVLIVQKGNLVTPGHPVEPDQRRKHITTALITVETIVSIGAGATVLGASARHLPATTDPMIRL